MAQSLELPNRVTHLYDLSKAYKTVWHYHFHETQSNPILLPESVKIREDKSYYQLTGNLYALHLRGDKKWSRAATYLTPLYPKDKRKIRFSGAINIEGKKSLLVFQLMPSKEQLIIDVLPGFYPENEVQFLEAIEDIPEYY